MVYNTMSDEELIRDVDNDGRASERERVIADRLDRAHRYISEVEQFLHANDLVEVNVVSVQ